MYQFSRAIYRELAPHLSPPAPGAPYSVAFHSNFPDHMANELFVDVDPKTGAASQADGTEPLKAVSYTHLIGGSEPLPRGTAGSTTWGACLRASLTDLAPPGTR